MSNIPTTTQPSSPNGYVAQNVAAFEKLRAEGAFQVTLGRYVILYDGNLSSQHQDYVVAFQTAVQEYGEHFLIQDLLEDDNIAYLGARNYALV